MKVAQFPDYRKDNPYQQLLANALGELDVEVVFPAGYRRGLPLSRALAAQASVDVLHLHWLTPYVKGDGYPAKAIYALKLLLDLWLVKARGLRLIWTVHNLVSHETKAPKLELWLSRRVAAVADHLIVHSEGAKAAVVEQFKARPDKVTVIPHGDFADAYGDIVPRNEARKLLGLDPQVPVFLFFGMIRPYKGVEHLLKVWNQTPQLHEHAVLIIAGDARDPELAKSIYDMAIEGPNVHLHMRFVPDDEVPVFFGAADWAVLPFTRSLTSGSVALARTYSLPVIATMTEGTATSETNSVRYLYDPNNAGGLASTMGRALEQISSMRDKNHSVRSDSPQGWASIAHLHQGTYRVSS